HFEKYHLTNLLEVYNSRICYVGARWLRHRYSLLRYLDYLKYLQSSNIAAAMASVFSSYPDPATTTPSNTMSGRCPPGAVTSATPKRCKPTLVAEKISPPIRASIKKERSNDL